MNLSTLKSLQKRIQEATGADRELDEDVAVAFFPDRRWRVGEIPLYTDDPDGLGACVGLMREVLPGCEWVRTEDRSFQIWRDFGIKVPIGYLSYSAPLANDCLTFLDAIVSALIAEEEANALV